MPGPYDYAAPGGYSRARPDWVNFPDTSTPVNENHVDRWDQAIHDLKHEKFNVKDYQATGDGSTDDRATVQAAVNAAETAGGGIVHLPSPGIYAIANTVTLKSKVRLELPPGATIKWIGAAGGTMFDSGSAAPLEHSGITGGGHIDPVTTAGVIFDLNSPQFCEFSNLVVGNAQATSTGLRIRATVAAASPNWDLNRNAVFNMFNDLSFSQIGTMIDLQGTTTNIITLNDFANIEGRSVQAYGVRCRAWTDNNHFGGYHRYNLAADNAVGVEMNTGAAEAGVYANTWDFLTIDTFTAMTGRKGIVLNKSKLTQISSLHQEPQAEGGAIIDNNSDSHWIRGFSANVGAAPAAIEMHVKNVDHMGDIRLVAGKRVVLNTALIMSGTGSPEGSVTAPVGSLFLRTDAATSLYVKQTGSGNTGWVAK